ncbi:MAG: hypothetical protein ABMA64_40950 [Myxococcota bacterium]
MGPISWWLACSGEQGGGPSPGAPAPIGSYGLAQSGGFEDGLDGWTLVEGPAPEVVSVAGVPDGVRALKLSDPRRVVLAQELSLQPSTEYTVSFAGRADPPVEGAVAVVLRETLPGWHADTVPQGPRWLGSGWDDGSATFVTSAEAFSGRLELAAALPGGGAAWIDRISVCESAGGRCVDADDEGLPVQRVGVSVAAYDSQLTRRGRYLFGLEPHAGRLYLSYGDLTGNTGPIELTAYDPLQGFVVHPVSDPTGAFQTEGIDGFRSIDGDLWAPAADPRGTVGAHDFARLRAGDDRAEVVVRDEACAPGQMCSLHVLDVAAFDGALFAVGSDVVGAAVWRSGDDGATWTLERARTIAAPPAYYGSVERNYLLFELDGQLYTQTTSVGDPAYQPHVSDVFDGDTWSEGPDLLPLGVGFHARVVGGAAYYLTRAPNLAGNVYHAEVDPPRLLRFDGEVVDEPLGEGAPVLDFAVDGDRLYVLTGDREVLEVTAGDFGAATSRGFAPPRVVSLGVLGGKLYFGTRDSVLLVAR